MRGLGVHLTGDVVAYALLTREPAAPPQIVAQGRTRVDQMKGLYDRLRRGEELPWVLALDLEKGSEARLPHGWPLDVEPRGWIRAEVAAAAWEWETGRIDEHDIFLWLRTGHLLWSVGEPGRGVAGSVPRLGPLQDGLAQLFARLPPGEHPAALAVEPDAPGAAQIEAALTDAGYRWRALPTLGRQARLDRRAAGAALAALDPERPGLRPLPAASRPSHAAWLPLVAAAACAWGAWAMGESQADRLEAWRALPRESRAERLVERHAPLPEALEELLLRRAAVRQALDELLAAVPDGSLAELDLLSAPGSRAAAVRVELAPESGSAWQAGLTAALRPDAPAEDPRVWRGTWMLPQADAAEEDSE